MASFLTPNKHKSDTKLLRNTWRAKDRLKFAVFVKDLYAMVQSISNNDILIHAKAEAMR